MYDVVDDLPHDREVVRRQRDSGDDDHETVPLGPPPAVDFLERADDALFCVRSQCALGHQSRDRDDEQQNDVR